MWRIVLLLAVVMGLAPVGGDQGKGKGESAKPAANEPGGAVMECCGGGPVPPCPPYCGEEGGD